MIDACVNFGNARLAGREKELLDRASEVGVRAVMAVGVSLEESFRAIRLAEDFEGRVFATAGCHPHHASEWKRNGGVLSSLVSQEKVKAVGECGLDYFRMLSSRDEQLDAFEAQIELALKTKKPLFMHNREAFDDFRALSRDAARRGAKGIVHCFTGEWKEAKTHLDNGFDLGITGWVTDDRRGGLLRETVPKIPSNRLHLETDAPFLKPKTASKETKENEPSLLPLVAKAVAVLRGVSPEEIGEICAENSKRLFEIL